MATFKEYILSEVENYIDNIEDGKACDLSDKQVSMLANTIAESLCDNEWLSEQIMECIADEYRNQIQEVI